MKLNDKYKYALVPLVTAFLLCVIYSIKHIYPFGINTIDYYDMAQQIASFYYHVFDFLHGEKNLFYDPYTALSVNMAMSTSGCSQISLFNLFFLFVKRDMLLESLSVFLMIKMMVMSLLMYFYIHNRYKISYLYEMTFSVGYAFCGYVLTLYMTIQWLDVAALFPLLMYFLDKLIKDGKIKGYVIVLALSLMSSYYQTFMILIYIILMVGAVIFSDKVFKNKLNKDGEKYADIYSSYHLIKLLLGTVLSIAISSFIFIPQICQTLISARFNNENEGGIFAQYLKIVSTTKPAYTSRWWSLLVLSFAFAVIAYGIVKYRKDRKTLFVSVISLVIILSELIVEGVNLFWHFGSYVGYPIRNGYMIYFTVTVLACGFLGRISSEKKESDSLSTTKARSFLVYIIFTLAVIAVFMVLYIYSRTLGLTIRSVFHMTSAVCAMTFVVYLLLIATHNGKRMYLAPVLFAVEIVLFSYIMIGNPTFTTGYTEDPEQEGEYIRICKQLDDAFMLNAIDYTTDDGKKGELLFNRVKNPDTSLNANYGLVLRRPVLSNWTHLLSPKLQRDAKKMGYSIQYTRLLDAGGTVFSDSLISVENIISKQPLDEELYELIDTIDVETDHISGERASYYLYKTNYKLPFGIIADNVDYDFENGDIVSIYNEIYSSISEDKSAIAAYELSEGPVLFDGKEDVLISSQIDVSGKKALYYFSNQTDTDDYNTSITVNGYDILVPSIGEDYNIMYPAHFNNNAVYLGTFSDESVNVEINSANKTPSGAENEGEVVPQIISVDIDKLAALTRDYADSVYDRNAQKAEYDFSVDAHKEGAYLLLPLSYDEGYRAKINGADSKVIPVGGMFMALQLNEGNNYIEMKFVPKGMMAGCAISAIGIVLLLMLLVIDRRSDVLNKDYGWLTNLYYVGFIAIFAGMYLIPYVFYVIDIFV